MQRSHIGNTCSYTVTCVHAISDGYTTETHALHLVCVHIRYILAFVTESIQLKVIKTHWEYLTVSSYVLKWFQLNSTSTLLQAWCVALPYHSCLLYQAYHNKAPFYCLRFRKKPCYMIKKKRNVFRSQYNFLLTLT